MKPVLSLGQDDDTALSAWLAEYDDAPGRTAVALFNAGDSSATVSAAVAGGGCVVNVWTGQNEGALPASGVLLRTLPPHEAGLWSVAAC